MAAMPPQVIGLRQNERGQNVPIYGERPRIHELKPWYWGLYAARDGRIWVRRAAAATLIANGDGGQREPAEPNLFDVFDATGGYLGAVLLPQRLSPYRITATHIWGVEYGAFDVPYVVRYRIAGQ